MNLATRQHSTSSPFLYLWIPALWGTGLHNALEEKLPQVRRICTGVPLESTPADESRCWKPDVLPLSSRELRAYVAELESYTHEMGRGRENFQTLLLARESERAQAELARDLADIAALGGREGKAGPQSGQACLERAQRLLAWFWFQQKKLAEIDELVASVNAHTFRLARELSGDEDAGPGPLAALPALGELNSGLEPMGGSWRVWLEAALALTPHNTVFVWDNVPESLPELNFSADVDFARALEAPEDLQVLGSLVPAGDLLPTSSCLPDPEGPVRFVRLVRREEPSS